MLAILGEAPVPLSKSNSVSSQSSEDSFTEGSFGAAMRKFVEKKKQPKIQKKSNLSLEDKVKTAIDSYANKPVESCGISFWKEMSNSSDNIERAM